MFGITTKEDASWSRRAARWFVLAALATFLAVAVVAPASPHPAAAQFVGGLNLTLNASPSSAAPGQVVTFSYSASPPAVAPPFPSIQFISVDFGDGQSSSGNSGGPGQTVSGSLTHVYNSPGTYTATLSAAATNGSSNTTSTSVSVSGGSGPSVSITASPLTVTVGQTVNFSYSVNTSVGIGFPTVQSILINYGDGAPLPLQSSSGTVGHTYSAPGLTRLRSALLQRVKSAAARRRSTFSPGRAVPRSPLLRHLRSRLPDRISISPA